MGVRGKPMLLETYGDRRVWHSGFMCMYLYHHSSAYLNAGQNSNLY